MSAQRSQKPGSRYKSRYSRVAGSQRDSAPEEQGLLAQERSQDEEDLEREHEVGEETGGLRELAGRVSPSPPCGRGPGQSRADG